jgi:hypothetical protein
MRGRAIWRAAARLDPGWQWMARGSVLLYSVSASFNDTFSYASAAYFFALLFALIVGRLSESRQRPGEPVSPGRAA